MARQGQPATPEFRTWFEDRIKNLRIITEKIVKSGEQHVPALFIFEKNSNRVGVVPCEMGDGQEKDITFALQRFLAGQDFVEGVIFVVEAWTKVMPADAKPNMNRSLEHDPDREEAIIFNGQSGAMQLIARCLIDRADNTLGDPLFMDPLGDKSWASGRMVFNDPVKH